MGEPSEAEAFEPPPAPTTIAPPSPAVILGDSDEEPWDGPPDWDETEQEDRPRRSDTFHSRVDPTLIGEGWKGLDTLMGGGFWTDTALYEQGLRATPTCLFCRLRHGAARECPEGLQAT